MTGSKKIILYVHLVICISTQNIEATVFQTEVYLGLFLTEERDLSVNFL